MTTHLVIPDCHVKHEQDMTHIAALSNFILATRPDKIVCLGDFADMESLCSYDKGLRKFEGRRYKHDVASAVTAQNILFSSVADYNIQRTKNKKKLYLPETYMLVGNHENRISRATQIDPVLDGTISVDDLMYHVFWDNVHPFLDVVNIDGVHYSHYFVSGVMGRPIHGEHPAASLLAKQHVSCTVGHSHVCDYSQRTTASGKKLHGLVAGCFTNDWEDYAGPANDLWWRGVVVKHDVKEGEYDPEFISMDRLLDNYL